MEWLCEELSAGLGREIEEHATACPECRRELESFGMLSAALAVESTHPTSEELCSLALGSRGLDLEARISCERHVAACAACRSELETARKSVAAARRSRWLQGLLDARPRGGWLAPIPLATAAAAAFALVAGLAVLSPGHTTVPEELHLANDSIAQTSRTVSARRSIVVETTEVQAGTTLKLNSPTVVFGDGFVVGSGAVVIAGGEETMDLDRSPVERKGLGDKFGRKFRPRKGQG